MRVAVLRGEKEISIHEESRDSTVGAVGAGCWRGNWEHSSAHREKKVAKYSSLVHARKYYILYIVVSKEKKTSTLLLLLFVSR